MALSATAYAAAPLLPAEQAELDQEQHERLAHIVNASPALIVALSPGGAVRFMNSAAERVSGFSATELVGQSWWTLCDLGDQHDQVVRLLQLLAREDVASYELPLYARGGQERLIRWAFRRQVDDAGVLQELLGWGIDITQERARRAQRDQRLPLRPQPQLDAELLAVATYQVNAALAPLLLGLQLLGRHAQRAPTIGDGATLALLAGQTLKLSRLLNALLRLLQLPEHTRSPQATPVDLGRLISQHLELLTPALRGQPVVVLLPAEPLVVPGEPALLEQLLELLLDDALRASPAEACIEVRLEAAGAHARIVIVDQGPLVPLAQLPAYLLPFAHEPATPASPPPRLGVGLFVAQHIAARHGGTLEVRTTERHEHSLVVTLPGAKTPSCQEARGAYKEPPGPGAN